MANGRRDQRIVLGFPPNRSIARAVSRILRRRDQVELIVGLARVRPPGNILAKAGRLEVRSPLRSCVIRGVCMRVLADETAAFGGGRVGVHV